ncbi:MAG: phosphopantothenate/pantothenate synthetase [Candidatus Thermoplasmatota archaeon]|nr:phosphopantothenate/pantothenate synthetase [Euryarchaeota archaeon]MBU4032430.1 phosphopantothenate/pantothenate synthetase [Candidatus Thermoplasmatota archaeon]MBU4070767.1 phosphopantothenate/pantothenate synthetase [Candidatus Thermoplasmatota archaeon]MBU4144684.1 phosphopantothenate/pantothenate synthetase [Candidatus Thermoplasmatota archaeon]MBU4592755.1 phosphopantothenate/pantothenate synthetase [Candidatus Thermoplasmatota archaeon]
MTVPKSHPRYESLMKRDKLIEAYKSGMVAEAGMIAHGRGEAFDYLLGECTIPEAEEAEMVAASLLLNANNPVISVNGNVAALCPEALVELARIIPAKLEVNLFYRTDERMKKLVKHLEDHGAENVLGLEPDAHIPGLEHARGLCTNEGIFSADVVLVPLEDGDRALALGKMGKTTIIVDLNPLSRSARAASVTIVDEVTRAIPNITEFASQMKGQPVPDFDNSKNLRKVIDRISHALFELRCAFGQG